MHILVTDKRTGSEEWIPLEEAAERMNLDDAEIEWALEEFGECESVDHIAIQPEQRLLSSKCRSYEGCSFGEGLRSWGCDPTNPEPELPE